MRGGLNWWHIKYATGVNGWSVEDNLQKLVTLLLQPRAQRVRRACPRFPAANGFDPVSYGGVEDEQVSQQCRPPVAI